MYYCIDWAIFGCKNFHVIMICTFILPLSKMVESKAHKILVLWIIIIIEYMHVHANSRCLWIKAIPRPEEVEKIYDHASKPTSSWYRCTRCINTDKICVSNIRQYSYQQKHLMPKISIITRHDAAIIYVGSYNNYWKNIALPTCLIPPCYPCKGFNSSLSLRTRGHAYSMQTLLKLRL